MELLRRLGCLTAFLAFTVTGDYSGKKIAASCVQTLRRQQQAVKDGNSVTGVDASEM